MTHFGFGGDNICEVLYDITGIDSATMKDTTAPRKFLFLVYMFFYHLTTIVVAAHGTHF